jgi:hypothetical protein
MQSYNAYLHVYVNTLSLRSRIYDRHTEKEKPTLVMHKAERYHSVTYH